MKLKKSVIAPDDKEALTGFEAQTDDVGKKDNEELPDTLTLLKRIEELEKENKKIKEALETKDADDEMNKTIR